MDLAEALMLEHSKRQAIVIRDYVGNDPERFAALVNHFHNGDKVLSQRAAYAITYCTDVRPHLAEPYLEQFIRFAGDNPPHVAVKRNVVRILQGIDLPEDLEGMAYDLCWEFVNSSREDIAVRVFSLTVLANIARKYPELSDEVRGIAMTLSNQDSPALRNRSGKVLKMLS